MKNRLKVVVIIGPTASGKTDLSVGLARKFNGVVLSADSRQIYKGMDIATAKITKPEQHGIPHYLIDIAKPDQVLTVSDWQRKAKQLLNKIAKNNLNKKKPIVPFIVGGTGLYVKSLVDGYMLPKIKPSQALRDQLEKKTLVVLQKQLLKLNPNTKTDLKNKRRIIRAIEIELSGAKINSSKPNPDFEFLQLGITAPKETLYKRIEQRIGKMVQLGLIQETQKLIKQGCNFDKPAGSAHGYRHIKDYLENKIDLEKALELMARDTKRYTKRQLTWFKKDKRIRWIKNSQDSERWIKKFLNE